MLLRFSNNEIDFGKMDNELLLVEYLNDHIPDGMKKFDKDVVLDILEYIEDDYVIEVRDGSLDLVPVYHGDIEKNVGVLGLLGAAAASALEKSRDAQEGDEYDLHFSSYERLNSYITDYAGIALEDVDSENDLQRRCVADGLREHLHGAELSDEMAGHLVEFLEREGEYFAFDTYRKVYVETDEDIDFYERRISYDGIVAHLIEDIEEAVEERGMAERYGPLLDFLNKNFYDREYFKLKTSVIADPNIPSLFYNTVEISVPVDKGSDRDKDRIFGSTDWEKVLRDKIGIDSEYFYDELDRLYNDGIAVDEITLRTTLDSDRFDKPGFIVTVYTENDDSFEFSTSVSDDFYKNHLSDRLKELSDELRVMSRLASVITPQVYMDMKRNIADTDSIELALDSRDGVFNKWECSFGNHHVSSYCTDDGMQFEVSLSDGPMEREYSSSNGATPELRQLDYEHLRDLPYADFISEIAVRLIDFAGSERLLENTFAVDYDRAEKTIIDEFLHGLQEERQKNGDYLEIGNRMTHDIVTIQVNKFFKEMSSVDFSEYDDVVSRAKLFQKKVNELLYFEGETEGTREPLCELAESIYSDNALQKEIADFLSSGGLSRETVYNRSYLRKAELSSGEKQVSFDYDVRRGDTETVIQSGPLSNIVCDMLGLPFNQDLPYVLYGTFPIVRHRSELILDRMGKKFTKYDDGDIVPVLKSLSIGLDDNGERLNCSLITGKDGVTHIDSLHFQSYGNDLIANFEDTCRREVIDGYNLGLRFEREKLDFTPVDTVIEPSGDVYMEYSANLPSSLISGLDIPDGHGSVKEFYLHATAHFVADGKLQDVSTSINYFAPSKDGEEVLRDAKVRNEIHDDILRDRVSEIVGEMAVSERQRDVAQKEETVSDRFLSLTRKYFEGGNNDVLLCASLALNSFNEQEKKEISVFLKESKALNPEGLEKIMDRMVSGSSKDVSVSNNKKKDDRKHDFPER